MSMFKWLRRRWWQFRHEVYYYSQVPVPLKAGDDIAMIQFAIYMTAREPDWFTDIYAAYERKWYRFLLKKPVLNASVKFQAGTYMIGDNGSIQGQGSEHIIIVKETS